MSASVQPQLSTNAETGQRRSIDWVSIVWFGALLAASYGIVLVRSARLWFDDLNMSHGLFVPLLAGYIVWQTRDRLRDAAVRPNRFGLVLMILGGVTLCMGPPQLDTFASATRLAFLLSLGGTILYLRGIPTLRLCIYPLLLLMLMFPLPGPISDRVTFPLQMIASRLAETLLEWSGYSVLREGNILHLPGQTLSVAEACSGLRSLVALTFLAQAYIYLFEGRVWMRAVIAVCVIPIAVFANSIRIVGTAIAGNYRAEWAHGTYHESTAWIVFAVAFLGIIGCHLLIVRIFRRVVSA
ncbi:MAG TPA: exosortase/archaeosortase family protein [Candidatus Solibacter sp.]|nr:exosortase/archaeosortase family protein [Candidatus Solibacter sp.]